MKMHPREYYLNLRRRYLPDLPKLIFVAESPPASGKYFYDPSGKAGEALFRAMMEQVGSLDTQNKRQGLLAFQRRGYVLVDATYKPVNKGLTNKERDRVILEDYSLVKDDLLTLTRDQGVPLLLIKVNVCRLLEPLLVKDGFNVLNAGVRVPFPSTGHQRSFHEEIASILGR
jgi:hypothetical protein